MLPPPPSLHALLHMGSVHPAPLPGVVPSSSMPPKSEWTRAFWYVQYLAGLQAGKNPDRTLSLFSHFGYGLPCDTCKNHYFRNLEALPFGDVEASRPAAAVEWVQSLRRVIQASLDEAAGRVDDTGLHSKAANARRLCAIATALDASPSDSRCKALDPLVPTSREPPHAEWTPAVTYVLYTAALQARPRRGAHAEQQPTLAAGLAAFFLAFPACFPCGLCAEIYALHWNTTGAFLADVQGKDVGTAVEWAIGLVRRLRVHWDATSRDDSQALQAAVRRTTINLAAKRPKCACTQGGPTGAVDTDKPA